MIKKIATAVSAFVLLSTIVISVAYAQVPLPPSPFDIPLTVERSADRTSATATWTPNQGAEYQGFFVVAKLLAGEPDTTGYGVKIDTFRYVDWPLAGDVGSLVITGLDPTRDYSYGVISTARDSNGNWVWSQWEIFQDDTPAPADTGSPETDRAALVALYNATNGPNWSNRANWLSNRPIGEWFGVTTDRSGRVTRIDLGGNQLSGQIPSQLGNLSNLQWLSFYNNSLSGAIPPQLGNLANLAFLDLGENRLTGQIPTELGSLANLRTLRLYNNQLSGAIPPQLGNLSNLTELTISGNRLSGAIPPQLGNLSNLQWLNIRGNRLSGAIPPQLGNLSNLATALISGNSLTGCIPASWQSIGTNDFTQSSLPFCGAPTISPTPTADDRAALVALYNATNGPNWLNRTNWLSNRPLANGTA